MQMTKERFEHELMKIKSQVGPEHVGQPFYLWHPVTGEPCIEGRMIDNMGLRSKCHNGWDFRREAGISEELWLQLLKPAVYLNNAGWKWHDIVDALVPEEVRNAQMPDSKPEVASAVYVEA